MRKRKRRKSERHCCDTEEDDINGKHMCQDDGIDDTKNKNQGETCSVCEKIEKAGEL